MNKYIIPFIVALLITSGSYYVLSKRSFAGIGNISSQPCTVTTIAVATVGNQQSSTILATSSRRAWARIQQPINATNTVSISFNSSAPATLTSGLQLTPATTTSADNYIDFGINTDFPYTGGVTGLTNLGSTTVLVTSCNY